MPAASPGFADCVFINCPFDRQFTHLLHPLVFTILDCGLVPRLALERADAGQVRFEKIRDLIRSCQYSIHDLSRMNPLTEGDVPRFNMPFELGLDLGCRYFGNKRLMSKQCLILEEEPFRYRRALSDIAGSDVRAHHGDPATLVAVVRNWLKVVMSRPLPSGNSVWERYSLFEDHLDWIFQQGHYSERDIQTLEIVEYIELIETWRQREQSAEAN